MELWGDFVLLPSHTALSKGRKWIALIISCLLTVMIQQYKGGGKTFFELTFLSYVNKKFVRCSMFFKLREMITLRDVWNGLAMHQPSYVKPQTGRHTLFEACRLSNIYFVWKEWFENFKIKAVKMQKFSLFLCWINWWLKVLILGKCMRMNNIVENWIEPLLWGDLIKSYKHLVQICCRGLQTIFLFGLNDKKVPRTD